MKRRIRLMFVLAIAGIITVFYGCTNSSNSLSVYETELKVMTFNIRYGTANDGENNWEFRKDMVMELIRENNPDILSLQEALDFQISEILDELPGYSFIGVGRDDGKNKGEFSAILFAKDRFIVDTTETFWFSDTPNIAGSITWEGSLPRICSWGLLFDKFSKRSLYVYNVHFDHQSQVSREKSAEMLIKKIQSGKNSLPVILTGDFNCGENNPAIQKIISSGLNDTYRKLFTPEQDEGTFNNFKGDRSGEKIDYIFVNGIFEIISAKIDYTNKEGKYPSDHFPVTAIVKYK
ncbi:MAG: endonuclease/exonuclease/phosphatase family protein [Ignavibacteria bacterium]|nr:endonuclease/exonuclease/phosphatase family protein [Ignavibacteria bacterium]